MSWANGRQDLNSVNILWTLCLPDDYGPSTRYRYLGTPKKKPVDWSPLRRGDLVLPMEPRPSMIGNDIVLADFGKTARVGTVVAGPKLQAPVEYCAPERLHGVDASPASDIWSFMCVLVELWCDFALFNCFEGTSHSGQVSGRSIVPSLVNRLGPLPPTWKGTYFDAEWSRDEWYDPQYRGMEERALRRTLCRKRKDADDHEIDLVMRVLQRGLAYNPDDRPTASQLLQDDHFNQLLALYGV